MIEQGKLTSPKLITQNLASLLPQKDISDIINATIPINLHKISSFSTRLHTYIVDSANTRSIRLNSICSSNLHIQKLISISIYEYLTPAYLRVKVLYASKHHPYTNHTSYAKTTPYNIASYRYQVPYLIIAQTKSTVPQNALEPLLSRVWQMRYHNQTYTRIDSSLAQNP